MMTQGAQLSVRRRSVVDESANDAGEANMNDGSAPWIKIITRIFEDAKIIALEQLPEGYGVLIIWFKLLTLAGEQNRGGSIYFTDNVPFTAELLAAKWRCKSALVQMALTAFQKFGMLGIDEEGTIWILNWSKYQNEEGLAQIRDRSLMRIKDRCAESKARIRELAAERQRKFRENKKQCGSNAAVTRNAPRNALRGVTGVTEAVTVTPELTVSHRETVTPQIENKIENKSVEEPSPVSQRETGANGHRQLSHDDLKKWITRSLGDNGRGRMRKMNF